MAETLRARRPTSHHGEGKTADESTANARSPQHARAVKDRHEVEGRRRREQASQPISLGNSTLRTPGFCCLTYCDDGRNVSNTPHGRFRTSRRRVGWVYLVKRANISSIDASGSRLFATGLGGSTGETSCSGAVVVGSGGAAKTWEACRGWRMPRARADFVVTRRSRSSSLNA